MTTCNPIYKFASKSMNHIISSQKKCPSCKKSNELDRLRKENTNLKRMLKFDIDSDYVYDLFNTIFIDIYSDDEAIKYFISVRNSDHYRELQELSYKFCKELYT